jgi:hypothetical protein
VRTRLSRACEGNRRPLPCRSYVIMYFQLLRRRRGPRENAQVCRSKHMELVRILQSCWLLNCLAFPRPNLASGHGQVVLKITITDLPDEQRWSLQGQLVGQWAAELKSSWREAHRAEDPRRCIVELIEVTSIDRNGEAVLAETMT